MEPETQDRPERAGHERFAAMVEPHLSVVRAFVQRRDPSLTDDVMSEVGVVAWRRLADIPAGHERAWLFGVARTVLMAEQRKARARHTAELGEPALDGLHAAEWSPLLAAPLAQALATLSQRDRELLLLTAWDGLSTAETASVLAIRATAARMGLVRARRRLASALDIADPGWRHPLPSSPSAERIPSRPHRTRTPQEASPCADAEH